MRQKQSYILWPNLSYFLGKFKFPGSSTKSVTICEHRKKTISCGADQVILIKKANYGRLSNNVCRPGRSSDVKCRSENSLRIIRKKCDKERSCELYAKNSVFGDPCPGTSKYLNVVFACVPSPKPAPKPSPKPTPKPVTKPVTKPSPKPVTEGKSVLILFVSRGK